MKSDFRFRSLVLSLLLCFSVSLFAEEKSSAAALPTAKEFLEMDLEKTFPILEKLTKEETKEIITQIRSEAKEKYPKIDHFYFLISHLEEMQAIEKEQARLKNLLWVYGLGLFLFLGFLSFLMIRQRKAIQDINELS
ncbi:hypothetical protein [Leptospira ilyithenensis]|uniref:Uncharacterized protein n=1 Tax=Leptospira ilyithenensis TaxID=2484901 RepID=A0A4R9LNC1_9LEPT|nr:hypothetical protein [Leptospira ilyithenensis]TGN10184.1 hypothetical protein EHS11_10495 [Leptospira ilyithenensis]